jgi:hypothetical protein
MAAAPDLIIALDTEYTRHRDGEDWGALPEAETRRNNVLCYASVLQNPSTGHSASGIIHTAGPEHRRRLYLGGLLARLLVAAQAAGVLDAIPGRMRLVLVMHFSRADLPGFRDFPQLKRLVDSIRGTYASSERPLIQNVVLPSGRRVRCSITVRDTLLLAPAGFGTLAALGEACGIAKLKLGRLADGTPAIEAMDRLRAEDPELFEAYALRDAEVALAWYDKVAAFMQAQLRLPVPPVTIGSAAVRLFRQMLERNGIDLHALLGQHVVQEGRKRRVERLPAYDDIRPLAESCYHGAANYAAVAGFMPPGRWTDVDITSAYTTCMAAIRLPDWQSITETRDPARLAPILFILRS